MLLEVRKTTYARFYLQISENGPKYCSLFRKGRFNKLLVENDEAALAKILSPCLYIACKPTVLTSEEETMVVKRLIFAAERGLPLIRNLKSLKWPRLRSMDGWLGIYQIYSRDESCMCPTNSHLLSKFTFDHIFIFFLSVLHC